MGWGKIFKETDQKHYRWIGGLGVEVIIYIVLFIIISGIIMVGTNILYDLAAAIIPIVAVLMIIVGVIVGFVVAIKNTFSVYKKVYTRKGK